MARPKPLRYDPNPGLGRISIVDAVLAVGGAVAIAVELAWFLLLRYMRTNRDPLSKELPIFLIARHFYWMPTSVVRRLARHTDTFTSRRYRDRLAGFPEVVDRPDFSAIWLTKPGFRHGADPRDADVVVMYVHGGGYVTGQPEQYATMLLCAAEAAEARGQSVAVLALRYSLAPERRFPHQLRQAAACWDHLTGALAVPAARVALAGDSAGANILLSLLAHMARPLRTIPAVRAPAHPGRGLFLLSPWTNPVDETGLLLRSSGPARDAVTLPTLRRWAAAALAGVEEHELAAYLEFSGGSWWRRDDLAAVLPRRVWVSAGADELLLPATDRFVRAARAAARDVRFVVRPRAPHNWQLIESALDGPRFLAADFGVLDRADDGLLAGAVELGCAIAATAPKKR